MRSDGASMYSLPSHAFCSLNIAIEHSRRGCELPLHMYEIAHVAQYLMLGLPISWLPADLHSYISLFPES